jgi:hypothetical protein
VPETSDSAQPDETSSIPPATSTPIVEPTPPESKVNLAPVIGGVVGGAVAVAALITILCLARRRGEPSYPRTPVRRLSIDEDPSHPPPAPFFSDDATRARHLANAHYDTYGPAMGHSRSNSLATLLHPHSRTHSHSTAPSSSNGGLAGIGRRDFVPSPSDLLPAAAAVVGLPPEQDYTAPPPSALLPPQQRAPPRPASAPSHPYPHTHSLQSARAAKVAEARRATHATDAGFVEDGVLPPLYRQEWEAARLRRIDSQQ